MEKLHLLFIEDDSNWIRPIISRLQSQYNNIKTSEATNLSQALAIIRQESIDLVITDNYIPNDGNPSFLEEGSDMGRLNQGLALALFLNVEKPNISLICITAMSGVGLKSRFVELGYHFFNKDRWDFFKADFFSMIDFFIKTKKLPSLDPKVIILPSHNLDFTYEVSNFFKKQLGFKNTKNIYEEADRGMTDIEKFEALTEGLDVGIVLFAEEDIKKTVDEGINIYQQLPKGPFGLGYFMAKLERTSGKLLTLAKLPSNKTKGLPGTVINILSSVEAEEEKIRQELSIYFK